MSFGIFNFIGIVIMHREDFFAKVLSVHYLSKNLKKRFFILLYCSFFFVLFSVSILCREHSHFTLEHGAEIIGA